jgi:hypothetical protein
MANAVLRNVSDRIVALTGVQTAAQLYIAYRLAALHRAVASAIFSYCKPLRYNTREPIDRVGSGHSLCTAGVAPHDGETFILQSKRLAPDVRA